MAFWFKIAIFLFAVLGSFVAGGWLGYITGHHDGEVEALTRREKQPKKR